MQDEIGARKAVEVDGVPRHALRRGTPVVDPSSPLERRNPCRKFSPNCSRYDNALDILEKEILVYFLRHVGIEGLAHYVGRRGGNDDAGAGAHDEGEADDAELVPRWAGMDATLVQISRGGERRLALCRSDA